MLNKRFDDWCRKATAKIRYGPDRRAVEKELKAHLEDRYEELTARGLSFEEATVKALESMGSAAEIAPQLGAIHRPWLGWIYSFVKFVGITTGLLAAFLVGVQLWQTARFYYGTEQFDSLPVNVENISFYCKPELTVEAEGYQISIQEAAVAEVEGETRFYFDVQVRWWPWMKSGYVLDDFWAVDSLGNYYYPYSAAAYDLPHIAKGGSSAAAGIYNATKVLTQFDADAQWVELRYDRDGNDLVFRIDLTGGGNHG